APVCVTSVCVTPVFFTTLRLRGKPLGGSLRSFLLATSQRDIELLLTNPGFLQNPKYFFRHSFRQIHHAVIFLDFDVADKLAVDTSVVGNRTNQITGPHAIAAPNFHAIGFQICIHISRLFITLLFSLRLGVARFASNEIRLWPIALIQQQRLIALRKTRQSSRHTERIAIVLTAKLSDER